MPVSGNFWLGQAQMEENANYIYDYFSASWSVNAISAMLGNMQKESTINPGIWQGLQHGNLKGGFGLVQWTPAAKYIDWAESVGYANEVQWSDMEPELERINYELDNGLEWIKTKAYPITFKQFTESDADPYTLAMAFLNNYERPLNRNQPERGTYAQNWYAFLTGQVAPPVNPPAGWGSRKKKSNFPVWLLKGGGV